MKPTFVFPNRFVWGAATAAAQIEGAASEDGKGESIWDRFSRGPGNVRNGDTPDTACDHYHRYREDFRLLRKLGIKNYRLSISWPRIYPKGDGTLNQKGVDFYHRLIDALLAQGITPWVTLFHWDLPQALEDRGGWRQRMVCEAFARYADTVVRSLGDRVKNWISLNEIRCFTNLGHGQGDKAPGTRETQGVINQTYHHALVCHGEAVRAVREFGGHGARVGLADNPDIPVPVSETARDIAAARKWFAERNAHILEPIYTGRYSSSYLRHCGADRPKVDKEDMALIGQPMDFLGLNIYSGTFVRAGSRSKPEALPFPPDYPGTTCSWHKIVPQSIYWGPRLAHEAYGAKSIYITENGCGYSGDRVENGEIQDLHRRDYLRGYLKELHRAISDKVPVRGYFVWSLLDNFEWQDGYSQRFGIVHVDYATLKRTPKLSAWWLTQMIKENRVI